MKVILADDSIDKKMDIQTILRNIGIYDCKWTSSVYETLEELNNDKYGLIISDMQYPLVKRGPVDDFAGEKLIYELEKMNIRIPVIICSSLRYTTEKAFANIWFNMRNNIEAEFIQVFTRLKNGGYIR